MGLLMPAELRKIEELINDFLPFAQERMGYKDSPSIRFAKDPDNAKDPLGKTAYYEPASSQITVYIDGRHPKDIVRSVAHELVHHTQNGRGDLEGQATAGEQGYAQNDEHLREMEREAYEQGNLCFRDWEDSVKADNYNYNEGLDMWDKRNLRLNKRLMERFGYNVPTQEAHEGGEGVHDVFNLPPDETPESSGDPKEDAIRAVVAQSTAGKIDGVTLDLFSAGAIVQILDALSPENKAKYMQMPVDKMAEIAMKMMKENKLKEYGDHETQAAGGLVSSSYSSDPERDQVVDITLDVVERGGQLMQVATALQDQGFDASLKMGVLMVDGKYFVGKADKFEISGDEDMQEAGPYVVGYMNMQEGKLPPALQAAIDKKEGKDGDDDKDEDEDESKTEGKLPPALQAAIDKKKGKDGDDDEDEEKEEVEEAYQGAKSKPAKQAWDKPKKSEKKVEREKDRKAGKKQAKDEKIKEAIRRVLNENPHFIKILKESEMSKKDFVKMVQQKQAPSRGISDEEAGSVESFNNWLNDESSPEHHQRQQEWEPAQSYRGGRVLAYNRKDQEYYDVQNDMPVSDEEMDAILPEVTMGESDAAFEQQGAAFNEGDPVKIVASALTIDGEKTGTVISVEKGAINIKLDDDQEGKYVPADKVVKVKPDYVEPAEGVTTMKEKDININEGDNVGHHAMIDGEYYVDSNFLNKLNSAEMGSLGYLEHIGMGDFSFNSDDGKESRYSRGGKDIPGQVGRSHEVYAHPPEFIEEIIAAMEAAGHSISAEGVEEPAGVPPVQENKLVNTILDTLQKKLNEYGYDDDDPYADEDPEMASLEKEFPWMKDKKKGGARNRSAEEQAAIDAGGEFDAPPEEEEEEDVYQEGDLDKFDPDPGDEDYRPPTEAGEETVSLTHTTSGKEIVVVRAAVEQLLASGEWEESDPMDDFNYPGSKHHYEEANEDGEERYGYDKRDRALNERLTRWAVK